MEKNKKLLIIFLVGFIIGIIGFTTSFILYLNCDKKVDEPNNADNIMASGIIFNSIDNTIYLEKAMPTLDKFGKEEKGFSFSIKNTTNNPIKYQLYLVDDNSTINNGFIRYELTKNDQVLGIYSLKEDGILDKNLINPNEDINYIIKIWLDYNSNVKIGRLSKKIAVSEIIDENKKDVNKPILVDGMIPVYYDEITNSWYKSDGINTYNSTWYDYDKQNWANAVTVNSERRDYYQNSKIGTRIVASDINSMWVWIPRFSVDVNNKNINVSFVDNNMKAYPAFNFDGNELEGFWFSKFESGMDEESDCISLSLTKKCNDSSNLLYFVPNYNFSTKITMANLFYAIRKMEMKDNIYGFNGNGTILNSDGSIKDDDNNIDVHMIKNTEWQAVALLSSSKYGKTGNNKYDKENKMIVNNNSNLTGKSVYQNELFSYNVLIKGESASTTGNVSGIYDMAGGKREYVMVNNDEIDIFNKKSNSGFINVIKDYYYDNGFSDNDMTMSLKEMYSDENLINEEPITRGGYKNTGNIFNIYGANDYLDKISVDTNSRACLVVIKEKNNEKKEG